MALMEDIVIKLSPLTTAVGDYKLTVRKSYIENPDKTAQTPPPSQKYDKPLMYHGSTPANAHYIILLNNNRMLQFKMFEHYNKDAEINEWRSIISVYSESGEEKSMELARVREASDLGINMFKLGIMSKIQLYGHKLQWDLEKSPSTTLETQSAQTGIKLNLAKPLNSAQGKTTTTHRNHTFLSPTPPAATKVPELKDGEQVASTTQRGSNPIENMDEDNEEEEDNDMGETEGAAGGGGGAPPEGGGGEGAPPTGGNGEGAPPTGGDGEGAAPTGEDGEGAPPTGGDGEGAAQTGAAGGGEAAAGGGNGEAAAAAGGGEAAAEGRNGEAAAAAGGGEAAAEGRNGEAAAAAGTRRLQRANRPKQESGGGIERPAEGSERPSRNPTVRDITGVRPDGRRHREEGDDITGVEGGQRSSSRVRGETSRDVSQERPRGVSKDRARTASDVEDEDQSGNFTPGGTRRIVRSRSAVRREREAAAAARGGGGDGGAIPGQGTAGNAHATLDLDDVLARLSLSI
jgi:hypothetical protein